jgi:hypothetical protein
LSYENSGDASKSLNPTLTMVACAPPLNTANIAAATVVVTMRFIATPLN